MWAGKQTNFLSLVAFLSVIATTSCKPFLQNAPAALISLAGSASSSASSFQHLPYTNIADLTRRNDKVLRLEDEKSMIDHDAGGISPTEEMNNNEATPSFFQKKIDKIVAKFHLISQLTNLFQSSSNPSTEDPQVFTETTTIEEEAETVNQNVNITLGDLRDVEEISEPTMTKEISSKAEEQLPQKITLDINEESDGNNTLTEDSNDKKQKNPLGQFGIFLAEILGSIVTLAYGAVMQFNYMSEGTTASPPSYLN